MRSQAQKQMRRRASHPAPHPSWISLVYLPAAKGSGTTVLVRQHSPRAPLLPVQAVERRFRESLFLAFCDYRQPNPLKEQAVEEAAMPGQPARARARFRFSPGNSPSRIASCHQRHRNHRSASVESSNVFAEPTLGEDVAARNRKTLPACEQAVDDATSLWKAEENAGEILTA